MFAKYAFAKRGMSGKKMGKKVERRGYAEVHFPDNSKMFKSELNNPKRPFEFTPENWAKAKKIMAKYPTMYKKAALLPMLDLAQRQCGGWIPINAMNKVADILEISQEHAHEVATFYSMYNHKPVGKNFVQVCTTTPCQLRNSTMVVETCKKHLGIGLGQTTPDGKFTLIEVECLGACVHAPMMQINDDYYEDLDEETTVDILTKLANGEKPKVNSRLREVAEPVNGITTLTGEIMGPYAPNLD